MAGFYIELTGMTELVRKLDLFKRSMRNRILRQAAVKAARILARNAKQNAPIEVGDDNLSRARAGLLKKSIGFKVTTGKDGTIVAMAGPRRGFRKNIGVRVRGKNVGKEVVYDPARTSHLVEFGSVHAAAKPFLRPAMEDSKAEIVEAVASTIQAALERLNSGP